MSLFKNLFKGSASKTTADKPPATSSGASSAPAPKFKACVEIFGKAATGNGANWLAYGITRAKFVSEHPELYEGQSGRVVPRFEEECIGRLFLAKVAEENASGRYQPNSPYFADLLKVLQAGYLAEYVWLFCSQPSWREEERPMRMPAFIHWVRSNLTNHAVETGAGVRIDRPGPGESPAPDRPLVEVKGVGGLELKSQGTEALAMLQCGNRAEAARIVLNIHRAVQALQTEPDALYLCFYNPGELNFYLIGHPEIRSVRALGWGITDGLWLGGVILSQERRFEEALAYMEKLIPLSPLNAAWLVEKGYLLNRLHRSKEALTAYSKAWDLACRLPAQSGAAGKVLRGIGVTLVELGDLDGAEKALLDSLIVEPESKMAKDELGYIDNLRRGGGRTSEMRPR